MTSNRQIETAKTYDDAGKEAGKATMFDLATRTREEYPTATVVVLSESDQGSWLWVDEVVTPENEAKLGEDGYADHQLLEDDDGLASCLYTDIWSLRELYAEFDVRGAIDYSERMGLTSFRMDVAKVLAECAPPAEPVHTVKVTDKTLDVIENCLRMWGGYCGDPEQEQESAAVLGIVQGWRNKEV